MCAWLNEPHENIISLCKFLFILSGCSSCVRRALENQNDDTSSDDHDTEDNDFESVFINDYFKKFKNTCETSTNLIESLLLCWIVRSILIQVKDSYFFKPNF